MKTCPWLLIAFVVLGAASRLIDHPWNFTPVLAIALFGGACFRSGFQGLGVTLGILALSDVMLSFRTDYPLIYPDLPFNYGAFALAVALGTLLRNRRRVLPIVGVSMSASLVFFLVSNFGVWLVGGLYPRTWTGLLECYALGVPFYKFTFAGDVVYSFLLFGLFALAERVVGSREAARIANLPA